MRMMIVRGALVLLLERAASEMIPQKQEIHEKLRDGVPWSCDWLCLAWDVGGIQASLINANAMADPSLVCEA